MWAHSGSILIHEMLEETQVKVEDAAAVVWF